MSFAKSNVKTKNTNQNKSPKMFLGSVKFLRSKFPSLVEKFSEINRNPKYTLKNTIPNVNIGKILSFFIPNLEYNKVAAKESDKAEDSLLKVETKMMRLKIINFETDCFSKYCSRK